MEKINLEWFFKLPGLFITGGVVLILIAAVVYLIASSKEKKSTKTDTNYGVDANSMQNDMKKEEVVTPLVNPSISSGQTVNTIGVINSNEKKIDNSPAASFEPTIAPITPTPAVENIVTPQQNIVPETPAVVPQSDNVQVVSPVITPVEPVAVTPVVPANNEVKVEAVVPETPVAAVPVKEEPQPVTEIQPIEINVPAPSTPEIPTEVKIEAPVAAVNIEPVNVAPVEEKKVETIDNTIASVTPEVTTAPVEITPEPEQEVKPVQEENIEEI